MACLQPFLHQTTKIRSENLILEIIFCIKFIQSFWWALGGLLIARESPEMTSLWGIDSLLAFLRSTTHKIEKPISFPCHRKHLHPQPTKKRTNSLPYYMTALEQDPQRCGYSMRIKHHNMTQFNAQMPFSLSILFSNVRTYPNPKRLIILFFSTKVFVSKFAC